MLSDNYIVHRYNWRARKTRPRDEWITIEVEPIVSKSLWKTVNELLAARAPKTMNPKVVGSERYYEAIEADMMHPEDVGPRIKHLRERLDELDLKLASIGAPSDIPAIPVDDAAVHHLEDNMRGLFTAEDKTLARRYLLLLIDKVVLDGVDVHVFLKASGLGQVALGQEKEDPSVFTTKGLVLASEPLGSISICLIEHEPADSEKEKTKHYK